MGAEEGGDTAHLKVGHQGAQGADDGASEVEHLSQHAHITILSALARSPRPRWLAFLALEFAVVL